jgi:hypothetical protein
MCTCAARFRAAPPPVLPVSVTKLLHVGASAGLSRGQGSRFIVHTSSCEVGKIIVDGDDDCATAH